MDELKYIIFLDRFPYLKELPNSSVEFGIEYHFFESGERSVSVDAATALEHVAKAHEIVTWRTWAKVSG